MSDSEPSDIIEIGEDGTFEIPETSSKIFFSEKLKTPETTAEFTGKENISTEKDHTILNNLSAGEYKVLQDKLSRKISVILCLHEGEIFKSARISQNAISID